MAEKITRLPKPDERYVLPSDYLATALRVAADKDAVPAWRKKLEELTDAGDPYAPKKDGTALVK